MDEQADEALQSLQTGMEMNEANPALNRDVASIINNILTAGQDTKAGETADVAPFTPAQKTASEPDAAAAGGRQHLFLSNYDDNAES